jgi:mRNA-degrading endonuclease RelE of RelBE toxin-antitoxin system
MTYELHFKDLALKEWKKLDASIQVKAKFSNRKLPGAISNSFLMLSDKIYKLFFLIV